MTTRTPIRRVRRGPPRRGTEVDEPYKMWIRKQPCVVCEAMRILSYRFTFLTIEAAHVGERGLGQRCPDRQCLPLCIEHHTAGPHSHHVLGKRFWSHFGLDRFELIADFNRRFDAETQL
jgi:hypothetical protein